MIIRLLSISLIFLLFSCTNYKEQEQENYGKSLILTLTLKKEYELTKINDFMLSQIKNSLNDSDNKNLLIMDSVNVVSQKMLDIIALYIDTLTNATLGKSLNLNHTNAYPFSDDEKINNYKIPSSILIGDPARPNKGKYSANELGLYWNDYQKNIQRLSGVILPYDFNSSLNYEYDKSFSTDEIWCNTNFYYSHFYSTLTILELMKLEVLNNKYIVIRNLFEDRATSDNTSSYQ